MTSLSRRRFLRLAGIAGTAALSGACVAQTGSSVAADSGTGGLRSPFPATPAQPQPVKAKFSCEAPPPAVKSLAKISKYKQDDPTRSIIDPDAEAKLREANQPLTDFSRGLTRMTDEVVSDPAHAAARADCAWQWLGAWADENALDGDAVAEAVRKWELATFACAVLKLRNAPVADAARQRKVLAWLQGLGETVKADYSRGLDLPSRQNNHLYWAAWAATATGIASGDRALYDWGVQRYLIALDHVAADGSLPSETKRAGRALGYHSFALLPLVMIAESGAANGQDLYQAKDGKLRKLAGFVLDSYADPSALARAAGHEQDVEEALNPRSASWLEVYYTRFQDPRALPWLRKLRPLSHRSAGGNLTMMFGLPLPAEGA